MATQVEELRRDVERRMRNGESYSFKEIRGIMRKTGMSYTQVIKQTKKLQSDIDKAKKEAEERGEAFDKEKYIEARMNG